MARRKAKNPTTPGADARPDAAEPTQRKKRGPKGFQPTDEHRRLAALLLGMGLTHDEARKAILNPDTGKAVDRDTFEKHFAAECEGAEVMMHARAARSLAVLIEGRPAQYDAKGNLIRAEVPINPASVMFYHKTRRGWRETDRLEFTGANGGPIQSEDVTKRARETLTSRIAGVATRLGEKPADKTTH